MSPAPRLTASAYLEGLLAGDRATLARAITLAESSRPEDALLTAELFRLGADRLQDSALRLGVSGPPGVGKSSLIDSLGCRLADQGIRVAVLAVDPSSSLSGGSILGDKTRMAALAERENSFIRPSPSGGSLGGVTRRTRESILLCELAGYELILVETVGVGQSETRIRDLCDLFLLLLLPGSGDELQGIKRGIMELADVMAVNKADGPQRDAALRTMADTRTALHMMRSGHDHERTVLCCSAHTGEGLDELWATLRSLHEQLRSTGRLITLRREQDSRWFRRELEESLLEACFRPPELRQLRSSLEDRVRRGDLPAESAVRLLMDAWRSHGSGSNCP